MSFPVTRVWLPDFMQELPSAEDILHPPGQAEPLTCWPPGLLTGLHDMYLYLSRLYYLE